MRDLKNKLTSGKNTSNIQTRKGKSFGYQVLGFGSGGSAPPEFIAASGGTVTTIGDYKVHAFTGNGTFAVSNAGNAGGSNAVDYMIVAGGGGGGGYPGCPGGAGGVRLGSVDSAHPQAGPGYEVSATSYPIVIGAGGAARAIVAALVNAGAPIIKVVNRTRNHAESLAKDIGGPIEVIDWSERHNTLADVKLVINATILGMVGKPPLELSLGALPTDALVNDIVYAPLETQLLKSAKNRGNPTVDGIGMLLHQARPGFTSWFGVEPEVTDDLRRHVLAESGS